MGDRNTKELWSYLGDSKGTFRAVDADYTSRLYFPLMNEAGMRTSVTPDLKGDISGGFDKYLMPPVVTEDLHRTNNSRYFWLNIEGLDPWSINGLSPSQQSQKWLSQSEHSEITASPGSFKLKRSHSVLDLEAEISITVPLGVDKVELWKVTVSNLGNETIKMTPFVALPLFGRHADNLRDHRQVTTMFQNCYRDPNGVRIKPTIVHDESGHRKNTTSYFMYAYGEDNALPNRIWTRMQDFIGEGGAMDNPEVVFKNLPEPDISDEKRHGVEAVAAMAFEDIELMPGKEISYIVVAGLTEIDDSLEISEKYNSVEKFDKKLEETRNYWSKLSDEVSFKTGRPEFDEWVKWLAFQLKCRQIFGNSFLPDFGYGRGGRGWRDLWQDSLSIFLVDPDSARDEIVNNLKGIRIDGSNATIIGDEPGEFKADRNNIPRTWCDHGAWPLFALNFYIQQTGDFDILLEQIPYWKDQFVNRSNEIDKKWTPEQGSWLKTEDGELYIGTVLEHVLIQQLSAFYNVGEHNILKLEGADWNDTLDMARNRGESVCFQSFYAGNLEILIDLLKSVKSKGIHSILLLQEMDILFKKMDFESIAKKHEILNQYFQKVSSRVSGTLIEISIDELIDDLQEKYDHSGSHIREKEWLKSKNGNFFFNGHYDDRGLRMHGDFNEGPRMDLTSQVMPVMCNIASDNQIDSLYKSAREILATSGEPGLRLCTKYPDVDMNIGRITGFVYGYKEHGSKWMQQNIMLMYGLFKRDKLDYGHEMLQDILSISQNSSTAKTFPGIASFYEPDNRGAYMYLTGSSTWIFLSLLTQIFGIRGDKGDLLINPKLSDWFFDEDGKASAEFTFHQQRIKLTYNNKQQLTYNNFQILDVTIDGKLFFSGKSDKVIIDQAYIRSFDKDLLYIEVSLG